MGLRLVWSPWWMTFVLELTKVIWFSLFFLTLNRFWCHHPGIFWIAWESWKQGHSFSVLPSLSLRGRGSWKRDLGYGVLQYSILLLMFFNIYMKLLGEIIRRFSHGYYFDASDPQILQSDMAEWILLHWNWIRIRIYSLQGTMVIPELPILNEITFFQKFTCNLDINLSGFIRLPVSEQTCWDSSKKIFLLFLT